jgi:hypothetical protein
MQSFDLDPPSAFGEVGALIGRMEELLVPMQDSGDQRQHFHATYLRTTRAVAAELQAGGFGDPAWVERWDVVFADLYLDQLDTADPPGPWAVAFAAAKDRPDLPALQHVLLGMNAHINYDLPQSLLAVIDDFGDPALVAAREADHRHIDEVLAARVDGEAAEAQAAGALRLVDRLLAPANRFATKRFLREARAKVWANTFVLERARRAGRSSYDGCLAQLERRVTARVAELTRRGPVLLDLAVRGFGVRLETETKETH